MPDIMSPVLDNAVKVPHGLLQHIFNYVQEGPNKDLSAQGTQDKISENKKKTQKVIDELEK
jgi:hypothetical protein